MLRPCAPDDEAFLFEVYAGTRASELAQSGWDDAQKLAFLRMQFAAQRRHYREHYADADFLIVLLDGRPVGRLYVARQAEQVCIIDISLLPPHRNAGIGSAILSDVLVDARAAGKPVCLHVEKSNPAQRLYARLGFVCIADDGVYLQMQRPAGDPPHAAGRAPAATGRSEPANRA